MKKTRGFLLTILLCQAMWVAQSETSPPFADLSPDASRHFLIPSEDRLLEVDFAQSIQKIANLLHQFHDHRRLANEPLFQALFSQAVGEYKSNTHLLSEERKYLKYCDSLFRWGVLDQPLQIFRGEVTLSDFDTMQLWRIREALGALSSQANLLSQMDREGNCIASNLWYAAARTVSPTQKGLRAAYVVAEAINKLRRIFDNIPSDEMKEKFTDEMKENLADAVLHVRTVVESAGRVSGREGPLLASMWHIIAQQVIFATTPDGLNNLFLAAQDVKNSHSYDRMNNILQVFQQNPDTFSYIIVNDLYEATLQYYRYAYRTNNLFLAARDIKTSTP